MVSVLAIGPKVRGFKPGRGDGLLRATKIHSTSSLGREIKPEAPWRKILRHAKITCKYEQKYLARQNQSFHSPIPHACYQMFLLVGLQESSGGWVRSFPVKIIPPWFCWSCTLMYEKFVPKLCSAFPFMYHLYKNKTITSAGPAT
jgi:hypothetical protein